MDVRLPDGTVLQNIPDGMSKAELSQKLQANGMGHMLVSPEIANDPISQGAKNFAKDMPVGQQVLAGTGKAYADIGRGASQLVGAGPSGAEVSEQRRLDQPLMRTAGGVTGNVAGNITALAPLALVPGANTIAGAGALGATMGALQPTESTGERLTNMGKGFALSSGTQAVANKGAAALGERAARLEQEAATKAAQNKVRDETLKVGREAGYVVPPSVVNPSTANRVLESVAGKAAVGQSAALKNQTVTDALARRAAGLPEDQALSTQALKGARGAAAGPYKELTAISPQAAADMEALKQARIESKLNWQYYSRSGAPDAYKAAKQADATAAQLETSLENAATSIGRSDLVPAMREARIKIAKIHDVEKAVNVGTGGVDASVIGRMMDKGAPLTGELGTIGRFQQAFPSYMREGSGIPTPQVSKTAALVSALMGGGGAAAIGPAGAGAAAVPFVVPPAALATALSKPYQNLMGNPKYPKGALTQAAADALPPDRAALLARALLAGQVSRPSSE